MFALQKSARRASARDQINIKATKENILLLPNDHYCGVLNTSSVNFELMGEEEQDAIIDTYESFLNSVGFPLQILVRTRQVDMDVYLAALDQRRWGEQAEVYRNQLESYGEFIRGLISANTILTRNFYLIVPYTPSDRMDFDGIREQLRLRIAIVRKGLERLGISSRQLKSLEILDLFYGFYNPEEAKGQPLSSLALSLLHTEYVKKGGIL